MIEWKWKVGGPQLAAERIRNCLRCSESKAQKIADGRYPSELNPLELDALVAELETTADVLYPMVGKPRSRAS